MEEGEYWERDLVDCDVFDTTGAQVGRVSAVIPGDAQDLLELKTNAGARLVPMVREIVVEIDPGQRRIVIDPPEGLLD